MENENEVVVPETTEEVTPEVTTTDEVVEESVEDLKARLAKAEELAKNQKIRAEKAEAKSKVTVQTETKGDGLTSKDIIAITRANINDEDVDDVVEYARFKKISISEAIKSNVVKSLIADKEEKRKVAQATNTGTVRRSSSKLSDDALMEKANKGADLSDEEMARTWEIRHKRK